MFGACSKAEHLGHPADRVYRHLQEHGNLVRDATVVRRRTVERGIVAGRTVVNQALQTRRVCHGGRQEEESKSDACGGAEVDVFPSQPRVDAFLDQGVEDDAGEGIDGFDGVVGYARVDHLAGLGNQVVEGLIQAKPVEWEEQSTYVRLNVGAVMRDLQNSTSEQSQLEFFNKSVVPGHLPMVSFRLCCIHAEPALCGKPHGVDCLDQKGTRRC